MNELQKIQNGNREILLRCYTEYQSEFKAFIYSKFPQITVEECREIWQETMVTCYDQALSGKLNSLSATLKTYLFAIGKNKCREHLRSKQRNAAPIEGNTEKLAAESGAEQSDRQRMLTRILNELKEDDRKVLKLYYLFGMSMSDLAEEMGLKNDAVAKKKKHFALKRAKEMLKKYLRNENNG